MEQYLVVLVILVAQEVQAQQVQAEVVVVHSQKLPVELVAQEKLFTGFYV
jgi:hypothetical protein